jgi:Rrf2 family protein
MISMTAKYALRATVYLASCDASFVSAAEIAEATSVPHDYLLKVLKELEEARVVASRRGPGGGYSLTKTPDRISVLDVVEAVETIPRITECPLGISGHVKLCPLHRMLDDVGRQAEDTFRETAIEDLVLPRNRRRSCDFPKKKTQDE